MTNRFIELLDKALSEAESLKKTWEQAMDTIRPDLPTWTDCEAAEAEGRINPLERFILDNEPCGPEEEEFRRQLADLVTFVRMGGGDTLRTAAQELLNYFDDAAYGSVRGAIEKLRAALAEEDKL